MMPMIIPPSAPVPRMGAYALVTTALGKLIKSATIRPAAQPGKGRSTMQMRKPIAKRSKNAPVIANGFIGKRHGQHQRNIDHAKRNTTGDAQNDAVHGSDTVTANQAIAKREACSPLHSICQRVSLKGSLTNNQQHKTGVHQVSASQRTKE